MLNDTETTATDAVQTAEGAEVRTGWKLTPNEVKALLLMAAEHDVRFYLNGVYLDRRIAVATDGARLIAVRLAEDCAPTLCANTEPVIVPRDVLEKALKVKVSATERRGLHIAVKPTPRGYGGLELTVYVACDAGTLATFDTKRIDGRYPQWQCVVPSGELSGVAGQFNAAYLHDFGKARAYLVGRKSDNDGLVFITPNGPDKSALVDLGPDAVGVLMPMRGEGIKAAPEWVKG